jgi:hypothetical protein
MSDLSRPILFLDVDGTLLPFGGPGMPGVTIAAMTLRQYFRTKNGDSTTWR